jgi:hypothetical protein
MNEALLGTKFLQKIDLTPDTLHHDTRCISETMIDSEMVFAEHKKLIKRTGVINYEIHPQPSASIQNDN